MSALMDQMDMTIPAELWTQECDDLLVCQKEDILEIPLLARADSTNCFYLKTDWSKDIMGTILLQAEDSDVNATTVLSEEAGGPCLFGRAKSGLRLRPIMFFSRRCQGAKFDLSLLRG
jgi:hypothetical protein